MPYWVITQDSPEVNGPWLPVHVCSELTDAGRICEIWGLREKFWLEKEGSEQLEAEYKIEIVSNEQAKQGPFLPPPAWWTEMTREEQHKIEKRVAREMGLSFTDYLLLCDRLEL